MENNKFSLAKVTPEEVAAIAAVFDSVDAGEGAPVRHSTSFDSVLLFNAVNGSSEQVDAHFGEDLVITDIVVTSADVLTDINDDPETGDKESKAVVHFFTADGIHISSLSNGIARATKNLLSVGFEPSPEKPITIRFKQVKTKKGIAHSFDLIKM